MTDTTIAYNADDAIQMLRDGGVDIAAELSSPNSAWADITDEIEVAGGEVDFTFEEFVAALEAAR